MLAVWHCLVHFTPLHPTWELGAALIFFIILHCVNSAWLWKLCFVQVFLFVMLFSNAHNFLNRRYTAAALGYHFLGGMRCKESMPNYGGT